MAQTDTIQRVRIYLSRDDQWEGRPRYLALLEQLRRGGATGATALLGLAGFGPGQRTRPMAPEQHQPVVVEWVDRAERVASLLPQLDDLLGDTLVTLEPIPVYRAALRARGPFAADRSVGDLMRRPPPAVAPETPLAEALALMIGERLGALPVVDPDGRLAGLIGERDLAWRAGLRLGLRLFPLLSAEEAAPALAALAGRVARDVMSAEPGSVGVSSAIPQALVTMIEWGYSQIPVVERDGRLAGLLSQEHVLRESVAQAEAQAAGSRVRDAGGPTPVRLVMQTAAHQVPVTARLDVALGQLLATPERSLLVVDAAGRLVGALDGAAALGALAGDERAAFLAALQRDPAVPAGPQALPGGDRGLEGLLGGDPPSVGPEESLLAAARRLLELGAEQLAVVDGERRLLGIIGRGGLIRALLQQSE